MNKDSKNILLSTVKGLINETRNNVSRSINYAQIISNWLIGKYIVEGEQKGDKAVEYGKQIIKFLSDKLNEEFGNGYNQTNLRLYRNFYLLYPASVKITDNELYKYQHSPRTDFESLNQHAPGTKLKKAHAMNDYLINAYSLSNEI